MPKPLISQKAIERRAYWVKEIVTLSGTFGDDSSRVDAELSAEVLKNGSGALLDHLRLCGSIPENYGHDTSEEKLYSKYTDALLAATYRHLGLSAAVLAERGDSADVEAIAKDFSLVADAKVFRLSRTAKNQKTSKSRPFMAGNATNRTRWSFVQSINFRVAQVRSTFRQLRAMCVFFRMHTSRFSFVSGTSEARPRRRPCCFKY